MSKGKDKEADILNAKLYRDTKNKVELIKRLTVS